MDTSGPQSDQNSGPRLPGCPFECILIYGMGLIGGSCARALAALDPRPHVLGVDADGVTLRMALDEGIVEQGLEPDDPSLPELLGGGGIDLVILAAPISCARDALALIAASGYRGLVTDTASTKAGICAIADEVLPDPSRFIPGHPMAGREVGGLDAADPGLFEGKHWVLCPDERTDGDDFARLHALITALGARSISLPRAAHDEMVAIVSHIPHMTAAALVELAARHAGADGELWRVVGSGFRDTTRVAAGSPDLWTGIALDNRAAIAHGLAELGEILAGFGAAIARADSDDLHARLADSARERRRIPAAWVPKSEHLVVVRVQMENKVGIIAEVTALAGRLGCNIQSIEIDHIDAGRAVLELVLTDEGDIPALLGELDAGGFDAVLERVGGGDACARLIETAQPAAHAADGEGEGA
ncbi:MAG: prephenate dehydrogenase/arogenate dehydrogenase family protein [Coriobacteriales bacterium]|jgi:prephenate dehydrogenase